MAQSFWQSARNSSALSPEEELQQALGIAQNSSAANIGTIDSMPRGPITAGGPSIAPPIKKQAVPRVPQVSVTPGSPLTALLPYQEQLDEEQNKATQSRNRAFFEDPKVANARMAELMSSPQMSALAKGNKDYRDLIAMEAGKGQGTDLSGLMAMGDVLSDGKYNLRAGYKPPADRSKELLSNFDKAQDNERDVTKAAISLLNSGKAGFDATTAANMLMHKDTTGEKTGMTQFGKGGNPTNQVMAFSRLTGSESKELRSRGELIDSVLGIIDSGNPTALQSVPTLAARIIEGTVRPQLAVISKEGGDPSFWQGIQNKVERISSGGSPEEQRAQYAALFSGLLDQHKKDISGVTTRWKAISRKIPGFTDQDFNDTVGPHWLDPHAGTSDAAVKAAPKSEKIETAKAASSHAEALKWANDHPTDPRAVKILQVAGGK